MELSHDTADVIRKHIGAVRLYAFHWRRLGAESGVELGVDADDLVQEVFIAYFRQHDASSSDDHPTAWLCRAVRNRAIFFCGLKRIENDMWYEGAESFEYFLFDGIMRVFRPNLDDALRLFVSDIRN